MSLHRWAEGRRSFIIRAKESQKFIAAFIKSGALSQEVNMFPSHDAIIELRKSGYVVTTKTALKVRLVRVDLPDGITEVLITDLWEDEGYGAEIFKELYFMRWNIETRISVLKNLLQLESFSDQTARFVEHLFNSKKPDKILRQLIECFKKHTLPIRKNRSYVRRRKNKQTHCKHKTFTNYKTSI